MVDAIALLVGAILRLCRARQRLVLENLALRQQLTTLKRRHPRPRLSAFDKLFWVLARRFWSEWKKVLIVVSPETVVRWHRSGFALYWRLISRTRRLVGRRRLSKEIRDLIFRMVTENPTWGAPRIHGELLMLGFDISERTISRWMRRGAQRSRAGQTVACLLAQSSGGHRRDGFLHCSDADFPRALLLFRYRPRSPMRVAFQRHTASLQYLDFCNSCGRPSPINRLPDF